MKALVVRLDGFGGVLLAGTAVRAVAARADDVTLLCGPEGAPAAGLLPHVDDALVRERSTESDAVLEPSAAQDGDDALVRRLRAAAHDGALVLAPYGQSPLPAGGLVRSAQVSRVGADGLDAGRQPERHDVEAGPSRSRPLRAAQQRRVRRSGGHGPHGGPGQQDVAGAVRA
ncbi:hypothetical protein I2W78_37225 [Streptomyces spinoverrucosus]|uniref:hypothetical protein n=1 Tax=Streptomyces spinoverrucosus TaxID=284043 RepID=UPI0018C4083D|nr:hypothetical protein [Streptomyces spinoverrucosus]MBG0857342.1 hypothetical protein [Streptomyces spinoverrucosus]